MAAFNDPTVADFKAYFVRDFVYGEDPALNVMDTDIDKGISDATAFINTGLFYEQAVYTVAFLNLSAHFMVTSLQSSSQGANGQYNWLQASKSVGSVSEGFSIPQRILDNPQYAWLSRTAYGLKFLMLILPQLSGQVFTVEGSTRP
jgi:hypothetical protein